MKTRNLLLALGCAAAFTACTNNDEPAVAPAMRTVTLSVEVAEPADTRVAYTEDGTTYKFAWSEGDKLRVFYKNSEEAETYADFTIDASTINGKKADFTGSLPDGFTGTVNVAYSSCWYEYDATECYIKATNNGYTSLADALKESTCLYAEKVEIIDGKLPNVKLNHAVAYLLLKKDLKVTDDNITITSSSKITGYLNFLGLHVLARFSSTSVMESVSLIGQYPQVYVEDGVLMHNILVPLLIKEETEVTPLVRFVTRDEDNKYNNGSEVEQPAFKKKFKPGVIYEMKTTDNWVISSFK